MIARRGLPTRWSRAWSLSAVDIGVSVVMALAFSGPLCALTTYQVDRLDGSAAGPALLGSTAMTLAAAIGGATTSSRPSALSAGWAGEPAARRTWPQSHSSFRASSSSLRWRSSWLATPVVCGFCCQALRCGARSGGPHSGCS